MSIRLTVTLLLVLAVVCAGITFEPDKQKTGLGAGAALILSGSPPDPAHGTQNC